jgi:hypothetical protein
MYIQYWLTLHVCQFADPLTQYMQTKEVETCSTHLRRTFPKNGCCGILHMGRQCANAKNTTEVEAYKASSSEEMWPRFRKHTGEL